MSRITGSEVASLMEAYYTVYAPQQEEVVEDLEVLDEAPMTAFQAAGGQAKLDQLNKNRSPRTGRVTAAQLERQGQENLFKAGGGNAAIAKGPTRTQNVRGGGQKQVPTLTRQDIINRGSVAAGSTPKPAAPAAPAAPAPTAKVTPAPVSKDVVVQAAKGGVPGTLNKTTGKWTAAPSPGGSNKPPVAAPAPAAPAAGAPAAKTPPAAGAPAKVGGIERRLPTMAELRAAQAARATARGAGKSSGEVEQSAIKGAAGATQRQASVDAAIKQANRPEVLNRPAPAGSALAKQQQAQGRTVSGSGALGSAANPQVRAQLGMKPINPAPAAAAPAAAKPVVKKDADGTPMGQKRKEPLWNSVDLFDIVKGHLIDEGYADTEESALAIMANMSEEWRQTILEADSIEKMRERAAKRRQQRYGKQGGGGRDDFRPYTEDDYKRGEKKEKED